MHPAHRHKHHDQKHHHEEHELPDHELRNERSHQWYVVVVSIVLLALFIPYFVLGPVDHVIRGQLSARQITQNTLSFGKTTIEFTQHTDVFLAELYTNNQELKAVETSACLFGSKDANTYIITEVFEPTIIKQQYNHVTFTACPPETLVMLHTHPYLRCEASTTDQDTFRKRKEQNPDLLMVIMCAPNKYVVYS